MGIRLARRFFRSSEDYSVCMQEPTACATSYILTPRLSPAFSRSRLQFRSSRFDAMACLSIADRLYWIHRRSGPEFQIDHI